MARILLVASTTGYQTRAFEDAARRLGVDLVYVTDRCHVLDDPWRDGALAVQFEDSVASVNAVTQALGGKEVSGLLALGDRPAVLAAHLAEALGLDWHTVAGVEAASDKLTARGRWLAAGLPGPWFVSVDAVQTLATLADRLRFPCVVKPAALSASRGVMRADSFEECEQALDRVRRMLLGPDVSHLPQRLRSQVIIEGFMPGHEYALEGIMDRGVLRVLAIFDKPDPLDGPFFEETIYVTPPSLSVADQRLVAGTMAHAALALGLGHGPVHGECRVNEDGIFVLEVAGRPIGGLCARALRFEDGRGTRVSLEELLLRHASGETLSGYVREELAAGVMMLPVPGRGRFRDVSGQDAARAIVGIEDLVVTAQPGQLLEPWPDGHSYPGFLFARAPRASDVVAALREAHARLRFHLDTELPLV